MSDLKMKPKLSLNKTTISRLSDTELSEVKGGFTYSLSTGQICQESRAKWQAVLDMNNTEAPHYWYIDSNGNQVEGVMQPPSNGYECTAL